MAAQASRAALKGYEAIIPFVSLPLRVSLAKDNGCASFSRSLEGIRKAVIPSRDTSHYLLQGKGHNAQGKGHKRDNSLVSLA